MKIKEKTSETKIQHYINIQVLHSQIFEVYFKIKLCNIHALKMLLTLCILEADALLLLLLLPLHVLVT